MKAKDYTTVEHFVMDSRFRDFVLDSVSEYRSYWEAYLQDYPEKILLIREAKQLVLWLERNRKESLNLELSSSETRKLWDRIYQEAAKKTPARSKAFPQGKSVKRNSLLRYGIAASLVFVLGFAWWINKQSSSKSDSPLTVQVEWTTNSNAPGTKSLIRLSDGSKITLNAGSEVRYKNKFDNSSREIFLSGEAFFEVAKDSLRPFIVHTGEFSTQALGTSFNIRSFEGKSTKVSLLTGVVKVSGNHLDSAKILQPGEGVEITDAIGPIKQVDLQKAISWTQKTISLDQAEFADVLDELSNWFGVEFLVQNQPTSLSSTTASYQDESLENILLGLSYKLDFTYEIDGKEITIEFSKK